MGEMFGIVRRRIQRQVIGSETVMIWLEPSSHSAGGGDGDLYRTYACTLQGEAAFD